MKTRTSGVGIEAFTISGNAEVEVKALMCEVSTQEQEQSLRVPVKDSHPQNS